MSESKNLTLDEAKELSLLDALDAVRERIDAEGGGVKFNLEVECGCVITYGVMILGNDTTGCANRARREGRIN